MNENKLKILGGVLVAIVVVNLILFALRILSPLIFWTVIFIMAIVAWKVVPKLKVKK